MNKWNFESCKHEALKYNTKTDFFLNSGGAYNASIKNNWLNEVAKHMIVFNKPKNYWTFEKCKEEALKYKTKIEFRNQSNSAYQTAKRKKILNEICTHMIALGNQYKKLIYSYEFSDNHVYVGLAYNIIKRNWEHLNDNKSPVYKHMLKSKITPIKKILTNEYVDIEEAKILESYWINQYKLNNWIILNKAKAGALGGNKIYWTFEKCETEAFKYKTRYEFEKKSGSAYNSALKNNWLDIITIHMIKTQKPTGYWNIDRCKIEALKYKTRYEFQCNSISAYSAAYKKGWLNELCSHMEIVR
jgi:hypothetical protein